MKWESPNSLNGDNYVDKHRYQCNVADFNRYCIDHTENQQEADKLAAKMFGRWRSGAPVTLSPDYDDETIHKIDDAYYKAFPGVKSYHQYC